MGAKIVVVGSFNMDLTAYTARLPRAGETVHGRRFVTGPGGKGSNQAVAAARLNADVTFVGRIGQDIFGEEALAIWEKESITTRYVTRDADHATGVAPIWVEEATGENSIIVVLGANLALSREDIDSAAEAIARADILITQLEIDVDTAAYALKLAKQSGVRTILNPAPAVALSEDMLAHADFITPNETELETLSRQSVDESNLESAAQTLITRHDQTVIVTMGARGACIVTPKHTQLSPAFSVNVVDTTGAGDAFSAGLAVALAEGEDITEAVRFANATAGLCATKHGTTASMPQRQEVEALLKTLGSPE